MTLSVSPAWSVATAPSRLASSFATSVAAPLFDGSGAVMLWELSLPGSLVTRLTVNGVRPAGDEGELSADADELLPACVSQEGGVEPDVHHVLEPPMPW